MHPRPSAASVLIKLTQRTVYTLQHMKFLPFSFCSSALGLGVRLPGLVAFGWTWESMVFHCCFFGFSLRSSVFQSQTLG